MILILSYAEKLEAETIERDGYVGGEYIVEINCTACHVAVESSINNETVNLWNTRQPVDNWKPIEELSLTLLKEGKKIVLYNNKRPFADEYDLIDENAYEEYEDDLHQLLEDVKANCSYYTLLTPPQTNQS